MPKRKRDSDDSDEGATGAKQQRIQFKLKQGTVKVGHAFKVAKGFERQKLGRRRKNAVTQKNEKDIQRIDAEIAALKTLDTASCARVHLYKSLSKTKAVTESPDTPTEIRKPATLSTDPAVLNVHARLCKSNQVSEALAGALTDVQRALGIQVRAEDALKKRRLRAKDYEGSAPSKEQNTTEAQRGARRAASESVLNDGVGGGEDDGLSDSHDSDDELEAYNDRLASSNNEDEEANEPSDVEAIERRLEMEGISRKPTGTKNGAYNHAADLELSDADSRSASSSPEPQKARPAASKKSSFLPSLSMGGYISGSGSDLDDDFDAAPKKNRRGQKARQQIWEKKFGTRAKHLLKEKRNEGWDAKRGATDGGSDRRGNSQAFAGPRNGDRKVYDKRSNATGANATGKAMPNHKDDSGPIHPSWEAAKKAKEQKHASAVFQGKKITFD